VYIRAVIFCSLVYAAAEAAPQATVGAGTVEITVTDPQQAAIPGATVTITNKVSGFQKSASTEQTGLVRFVGVPPNPYHVTIDATGFQPVQKDLEVRSTVPVTLAVALTIATGTTSVEVHADNSDVVENVPTAHTDIDSSLISRLPSQSVGQGMTDLLTLSVPGMVGDSNGQVHPLGDHAETQFSFDNQPISDQQNKQASNQIPVNAIQSFEAISGAPPAEYGGKAALVVNTVTKSGLGAMRPTGELDTFYGSFGTGGENFNIAFGNAKLGEFLAANTSRSGRFLDSPEFSPLHDVGDNYQLFDRLDWQADQNDSVHLNLFNARSWFQIPNTYDQEAAGQDQRQQVRSYNIAPGWTHLVSPTTVVTVNAFFRRDEVQYFPSADAFSDLPATISQYRTLGNLGLKGDVAYVHGHHNMKFGFDVEHDFLSERFALGITDPNFNPPCLSLAAGGACSVTNPSFQPGLLPYDLTRGGSPLNFRGHADIKQYGFFAQDNITLGNFSFALGIRGEIYRGLSSDAAPEPRLGASYIYKPTATVFRVSYSRFFETPYNENLVLSSSTGVGGLSATSLGAFGSAQLEPGRRNQYQAGIEQGLFKALTIDAGYFWKYTTRAYDFDTLFNTPITFPIEWRRSKVDGVSVRLNLANTHGFTAYTVLGHTRARFFGPEIGGLIFNSPVNTGAFRIDHDEALEQTTNLHYQFKKTGPWVSFTWRYDSGLVAGSVTDLADALALTADEQQAIGFHCGGVYASLNNPITSCNGSYGATRLNIPAPGTYNPDTNPPRIAPRNVFDVAVGTDNLFHTDRVRWKLQLQATNITNKDALYNFLSTFSGTHFIEPRAYRVEMGMVF
jgi:hypothetical protein